MPVFDMDQDRNSIEPGMALQEYLRVAIYVRLFDGCTTACIFSNDGVIFTSMA